ncbi:MAG: hypothetical protein ACLSAP_00020 [Oscillospiraceae bacterium]
MIGYTRTAELSSAIITGNDDYDAEASMKSVQKGDAGGAEGVQIVQYHFARQCECSELISTDNEKVVNTFAIGK